MPHALADTIERWRDEVLNDCELAVKKRDLKT